MLPPTASPDVRLVKLPPPLYSRSVARWLLLFGLAFVAVGTIATLTLTTSCELGRSHNPTIGLPACPADSATVGSFLESMAFVSLGSGVVALLAGFLGNILIRTARAVSHP